MTTGARAKEPASPLEDAGFRFLRECGDPIMAGLVDRIGPLDQSARRSRVAPVLCPMPLRTGALAAIMSIYCACASGPQYPAIVTSSPAVLAC